MIPRLQWEWNGDGTWSWFIGDERSIPLEFESYAIKQGLARWKELKRLEKEKNG